MSSYQQLKELALKQTQEKQAALAKEREAKEKDAAAKRAAQEARERARRETERKLIVQKMALRKEEEAKAKAKLEAATKINEALETDEAESRKAREPLGADAAARKKVVAGSTKKIDISRHLPSTSSSSPKNGRRKRTSRNDEDDFTGNPSERTTGKESLRSSSSHTRRKPVPLTREEKQQMKRAREFGGASLMRLSSPRASPSASSHSSSRTAVVGKSKLGNFSNEMVALGTKKRDQRTIDEIERDLRKLKESKEGTKLSQSEIEREAALLRRKKAMEERRKAELEARSKSKKDKSSSGSDSEDDLFGSGSEEEEKAKSSPVKSRPTKAHDTVNKLPNFNRSRESMRDSPPIPRIGGVNPADFLPGAPLNADAKARLAQMMGSRSKPTTPSKRSHSPEPGSKATKKSKAVKDDSKQAASPAPPPKRETERDRFIREQEAKKAAKLRAPDRNEGSGRRHDEEDSDAGSYDEEEDEYETEGDDEEEATGGMSYRDEIWKIFGKDRRKYASRDVESDDDMEADASAVLREEMRSAREAREEDLREEEALRRHEREKALRKKAVGGGR